MQSLFKQTRTRVHSLSAQQQQRQHGLAAAARAMAAIQLGTQLLLWITFYGYDLVSQTVWQAALMLFLPLALLWLVWRGTPVDHPAARWWQLPLLLCLLADAVLMITALGGFISQLVPTYPPWVCAAIPTVICLLAALCARPRGVRYGSAVLAVPLVLLLVFGTLFLRASTRPDRLWPILGDGLGSTAKTALLGAGSTWGAALLFALPRNRANWKSSFWGITPWALCVLWALRFGFVRPWSAGDDIAIAEKMMGLARHADSVILYETAGVMWMLLLPASLITCFSTGEHLITSAFPRLPRWAALVWLPVLSLILPLFFADRVFLWLQTLLPWRYPISLICGLGLFFLHRRRK